MSKTKSAEMSAPTNFLLLRTQSADKLGQRARGRITYHVLLDPSRTEVYLAIASNESSGYFSREPLAFSAIEACLDKSDCADRPLAAKRFASAFIRGRSANNAGFAAACLVAEGLLAGVPGKLHQLKMAGDWAQWRADQLAADGRPFELVTGPAVTPAPAHVAVEVSAAVDADEALAPERSGKKGRRRVIAGGDDAMPA